MSGNDAWEHVSLIPSGERRCIWMDAGVISLKICDRDFECDDCPLDRALRGGGREDAAPADDPALPSILDPLYKFAIDSRLHYHPGHTWMRAEGPDRVRVGLAPLLAQVLGSVDAISLQRPGRPVVRGVALGEIIQGERCYPLLSPLSGEVVEANPELAARPGLALLDPFDRGWIAVVAPSAFAADAARCRTGRDVFSWILRKMDWLKAYAAAAPDGRRARLGPTLHDGGEVRADLRSFLAPERYRRLVLALLGAGDDGEGASGDPA